jgi:hypothetical protein
MGAFVNKTQTKVPDRTEQNKMGWYYQRDREII